MKKYTLFFSLFLAIGQLSAQSAFHDALQLRQYLKVGATTGSTIARFNPKKDTAFVEKVSPILASYTDDPTDIQDGADLNDAYIGNPFISARNGTSKVILPNVFQAPSAVAIDNAQSLPSTSSGLFVTNLADGLAKFLVTRTKEELTVTFFNRFKDKIEDNEYMQNLFPQTSDLLELIGTDIYQFNAYLETLREHFIKDLKSLPLNLKKFLTDEQILKPGEQLIADDMLQVAQMLVDGQSPINVMDYLGQDAEILKPSRIDSLSPNLQKTFQDVGAGFKVADLISNSLRSNQQGQIWIKPAELNQLLKDKEAFYLYLGLLWQKADGIDFSDGKSVRSVLEEIAQVTTLTTKTIEDLKSILSTFTAYAQEVQVSLDTLNARKNRTFLVYDDYYKFFQATFSLMETGIRFKKLVLNQTSEQLAWDNKFLNILRHFNELNFNIRQKHYAASITNVVYLLDKLLPDSKFKPDLLKYGNFMAIVAEAETSDDVTAAIEAVALPTGSSITKKYASFSVALNAYTGVAGGQEQLENQGDKGFVSVAAPIGVAFSWGFDKSGSLSIYTPLIDVGAIAAYRFNDANTMDIPELNLQNILAPGGYLVYGFGNDIPLSIGFGAQLGPNLRAINNTSTDTFDSGWRWGAFLGVDIPLINLYVR